MKKILILITFLLVFTWQIDVFFSLYFILVNGSYVEYEEINCELPSGYFYVNDDDSILLNKVNFGISPHIQTFILEKASPIPSTFNIEGQEISTTSELVGEDIVKYTSNLTNNELLQQWQYGDYEVIGRFSENISLPEPIRQCLVSTNDLNSE